MLTYKTDKSDPSKETSDGSHFNDNDDPAHFPFPAPVEHVKGADSATIRADIVAYLGTQGRTGYDPPQKFDPSICPDGIILKDNVDGTTVWKIVVDKLGNVTTKNVTKV